MLNADLIKQQAQREIAEEAAELAKDKLKAKYQERAKLQLALRNVDREIEAYLVDVEYNMLYEVAGE